MKKTKQELEISEWEEVLQELFTGFNRDRNMAIVAIAFADDLIEKFLRKNLKYGNNKTLDSLFENNGTFSTFFSKINFLVCFGILLPQVYHDLNILRKIRNEFSHNFIGIDFDDPKIENHIKSLNSYQFCLKYNQYFKIDKSKNSIKFRICATLSLLWLVKDLHNLDTVKIDRTQNPFFKSWKNLGDKEKNIELKGMEFIENLLKVREFQDILKGKEE
jgi:DNA-binding MltR family transcriptional regulator